MENLENALMDGSIALNRKAESYEETAQLDHLDWPARREWYHAAGRARLSAHRLDTLMMDGY